MMNIAMFLPLAAQETFVIPEGSAHIIENDPYGLNVTIFSVLVVLSALLLLASMIWVFSRIMILAANRKAAAHASSKSKTADVPASVDGAINGEVIAAIALAIELNKNALRDHESEIITINKVARFYSPWSSKIHGLTNHPGRR